MHGRFYLIHSESMGNGAPIKSDPISKPIAPVFIKANFSISINGSNYGFTNQSISTFGISSLRWSYFDPSEMVGAEISVDVDVLTEPRYHFTTHGYVMTEETGTANYLGVQFKLDPKTHEELTHLIQREGFYPTQHIRKFPRIPAIPEISNMPLRAIGTHENNEVFTFDIANISPTGMLVRTENPRAGLFLPRQRVKLQIEPRGDNLTPCRVEGLICRAFFMKNQKTGNIIRSFGIRFVKIAEADRQNFLEILRMVLNNLQSLRRS